MSAAALITLASLLALPTSQLDIATRVAGAGRPHCVAYELDGTSGPCLPSFAIKRGKRVSATATGPHIEFTMGASLRLTRDEFALLAGHEIAHYFLEHDGSNRTDELAADRLGAELACKAGYNPTAGSTLFRHLKAGSTHPRPEVRRAAVLAVGCGPPSASPNSEGRPME